MGCLRFFLAETKKKAVAKAMGGGRSGGAGNWRAGQDRDADLGFQEIGRAHV